MAITANLLETDTRAEVKTKLEALFDYYYGSGNYTLNTWGDARTLLNDIRSSTQIYDGEAASTVVQDINILNNLIDTPDLSLNFETETYSFEGETSFDSIVTHSRNSNATMVDSDGLLKWAPHNLFTYSEQFDDFSWGKGGVQAFGNGSVANATTAPDGTSTADLIKEDTTTAQHFIRKESNLALASTKYAYSIYVKNIDRDYVTLSFRGASNNYASATFNLTGSGSVSSSAAVGAGFAVDSTSVSDVGNGWFHCVLTFTAGSSVGTQSFFIALSDNSALTTNGIPSYTGTESSLYIWGAHFYRSDLGGMVNNPDQPAGFETYVPTTNAAIYLPRRGHHVWNGSEWVNEGLLVESEDRTNLVEYSSNLQGSTDWDIFGTNSVTITSDNAVGSDGKLSLDRVEITDTANETHGSDLDISYVGGTTYTLSMVGKADEQRYVGLRLYQSSNNWATVVFDLLTGSVTQESTGVTSGTVADSGVISLGNDLYRCWFSGSTAASASSFAFAYIFFNSGTPSLDSFGGQVYSGVAGDGCWLGEFQFEAGSTPSSYIPTSGSAVTRAAETLTISNVSSTRAASFQMEGKLELETASLYKWQKDANNYIEALTPSSFIAQRSENYIQDRSGSYIDLRRN